MDSSDSAEPSQSTGNQSVINANILEKTSAFELSKENAPNEANKNERECLPENAEKDQSSAFASENLTGASLSLSSASGETACSSNRTELCHPDGNLDASSGNNGDEGYVDGDDKENINTEVNTSKEDKETEDSLQFAVLARGIRGYHETEYSFKGEADLHRSLIDCDKNPGHKNFIPINKFCIDHLPEGYKDQDIVDYIKTQAELTVRLTSKFTSMDRPKSYAFYGYRGTNLFRVGSGFVQYVYRGDDRTGTPCPCPECKASPNPHKEWCMVKVRTATHVVFDKDEAKNTVVELFYDENKKRGNVKFLYGNTARFGAIPGDWSDIRCVTHDLELCDRIKDTWGRWRWLETKVNQKYNSTENGEDHRLVVVVSHPHGCSKQVSVGKWVDRDVVDRSKDWENCVYTYDTPTCPGSSGAPVWVLGKMKWGGFFGRHPHSGRPLNGYNVSGVGWDRVNSVLEEESGAEPDTDLPEAETERPE